MIRPFDPAIDKPGLRLLLVELQEYERNIDSRMPDGESMADAYIAEMLANCDDQEGQVLVCDIDGQLGGYITVLPDIVSNELEDSREPYALISDIMVRQQFRGGGYGKALMSAAIEFSRSRKMPSVRLDVMAGNRSAHEFYQSLGFENLYIEMEMKLD